MGKRHFYMLAMPTLPTRTVITLGEIRYM